MVLALETKFLLFAAGQEQDSVLSWSPALPSPQPVSLSSPGQRQRRLPSWPVPALALLVLTSRPPSFRHAALSKESSPSSPAHSPPAKPHAPNAFAFRLKSLRSRHPVR